MNAGAVTITVAEITAASAVAATITPVSGSNTISDRDVNIHGSIWKPLSHFESITSRIKDEHWRKRCTLPNNIDMSKLATS